ncbi:MAG: hypothetical protein NTW60_00545 [Candidatus Wolfebacteria bacterium]|nr:hypothetical protein [Candidatus Wolfebacteria bacterium]
MITEEIKIVLSNKSSDDTDDKNPDPEDDGKDISNPGEESPDGLEEEIPEDGDNPFETGEEDKNY